MNTDSLGFMLGGRIANSLRTSVNNVVWVKRFDIQRHIYLLHAIKLKLKVDKTMFWQWTTLNCCIFWGKSGICINLLFAKIIQWT